MFQELRVNERVRISPVRLIDGEGNQVGIVETKEALARAREVGLDLVEVSPTARPPVCRIMDYGKWKYDQKKKERKAKSSRHETELKLVRIRTPKISPHDLGIKIAHAREFLERGDKVQFTVWFRGREMAHQDIGRNLLNRAKTDLADISKVERDLRMEGRNLSIVLTPTVKPRLPKRGETEADRAERADAEAAHREEQEEAALEAHSPAQGAPEAAKAPQSPAP